MISGQVLLPDGRLAPGEVQVRSGRIARFVPGAAPERFVLPGFVDLHVHGGGGADVMDGPEGVAEVAAFHLRHGTTSLCPTTVTRPTLPVIFKCTPTGFHEYSLRLSSKP